jgi:DNA-binding response OmpR family regulator
MRDRLDKNWLTTYPDFLHFDTVRSLVAVGHRRAFALMRTPPPLLARKEKRRIANLEIRPAELQVLVEKERVRLTVREFELFFIFAERMDSVVFRPTIYELMWGGEMPKRDRSVDVLVRKVRGKLELAAPNWRYIHTHFGIGYRFSPEQLD